MSGQINLEDAAHCLTLLKSQATDFYLADLLLPENGRNAIIALHAFHVEITNITLSGGEPMAGQLRLQWWVEVLQGQRRDEGMGHPVARALLQLIDNYRLPIAGFEAKLEAHIFDLYQDPMGTRTDFEAYLGETRSCLFQWAGLILGGSANADLANASGHSGVATGIVGVLENIGHSHNRGQVCVPDELLAATGMSPEQFLAAPTEKHQDVVGGLIDLAHEHQMKALSVVQGLAPECRRAFKPLALVPLYLKNAEKAGLEIFKRGSSPSQVRKQWALWRF